MNRDDRGKECAKETKEESKEGETNAERENICLFDGTVLFWIVVQSLRKRSLTLSLQINICQLNILANFSHWNRLNVAQRRERYKNTNYFGVMIFTLIPIVIFIRYAPRSWLFVMHDLMHLCARSHCPRRNNIYNDMCPLGVHHSQPPLQICVLDVIDWSTYRSTNSIFFYCKHMQDWLECTYANGMIGSIWCGFLPAYLFYGLCVCDCRCNGCHVFIVSIRQWICIDCNCRQNRFERYTVSGKIWHLFWLHVFFFFFFLQK